MQNLLLYSIVIPIVLGIFSICMSKIKKIKEVLALIGSLFFLFIAVQVYFNKPVEWIVREITILKIDNLSAFLLLAASVFAVINIIYSIKFMEGKGRQGLYYGSILWTLGATCGVLMSNHLILFLLFWGVLGITLYLLILSGGADSSSSAQKALFIIGGSDALILLGIGLIYHHTGTFFMDKISIPFRGEISYIIFILISIGIFAKIGAFPLHTWLPGTSKDAPVSASSLLLGSMDKLLGIYFLMRLYFGFFQASTTMNQLFLVIGSITIIASVMMGLLQQDAKKLLGYLVILGAGYMLLGFGSSNPIGIAGGLFYMISSALWTNCLFLCIGNVEHRTGTTHLDELGGLIKIMPITFLGCLIGILSISGIPPFNGFASKWLIYQGLIDLGKSGSGVWIIWLVVAMFGSALTLAIGCKLIHSIFMGVPSKEMRLKKIQEVGFGMIFPIMITSLLCIVLGVFAHSISFRYLILPLVPNVKFLGIWSSGLASIFIFLGVITGLCIYLIGNLKWGNVREVDSFTGGEKRLIPGERVSGVRFYDTVSKMKGLRAIYSLAEAKRLDIYDTGRDLAFHFTVTLQKAHTGILNLYMIWFILGLVILFLLLR